MDCVSSPCSVSSARSTGWAYVLMAVLAVGVMGPCDARAQSTPPIRPQAASVQSAGATFWVEVQVGSGAVPVQDLFGVSLAMRYDTSRVEVLDDEAGPFLGSDLVYSSSVDAAAGEVGIGVSRKSGAGGVDGAGVVARIKVQIDGDVPEGDTLSFGLPSVEANDPDGAPIALDPGSRGVTVATAIPMEPAVEVLSAERRTRPAPGDTVAVDVNVGTSARPVSDLFGTSLTWTYDPSQVTVLNDEAGGFLGSDVVYSSNLDAATGELGIGTSRKAGAGGVDGSGSVARVVARVDPSVAEGTVLTFGLQDAQAKNPADSSIALTTSAGTATVGTSDPPQTQDDTIRVRQNRQRIADVLSNDSSPIGLDAASVQIEEAPLHGTATARADGTIAYTHDGSGNLADSLTYTVADNGGQRSAPATVTIDAVRVQVDPAPANRGTAVPMDVIVESDATPQVTLHVRKGGAQDYRDVPLDETAQAPTQVEGTIADTLVTERGIDYYLSLAYEDVTLTEPAGGEGRARRAPRHLPVAFETLTSPYALLPETNRMVSVPATLANDLKTALREDRGPYNPLSWRLSKWRAEAGEYREFPALDSLTVGDGFWLISEVRGPLTFGPGQTVAADTAWTIPIKQGWNQIGTPFGFAVPWDTVQAASGLSADEVDGPFQYQEGGYQSASSLVPWEGYMLFATTADTLVVPPVGTSGASARATDGGTPLAGDTTADPGPKNQQADRYTLRLRALAAAGTARTTLGLRPGAKTGRDRFDVAQPPPVQPGLQMGVEETVGGRSILHTENVRPFGEDEGQSWRVRLTNTTEKPQAARLRLQSEGTEGLQQYVLDLNDERRLTSGAELDVKAGATRTMKVIVGTERYAEEESAQINLSAVETTLRGTYPNPFAEQTTIEYVLADEQDVTLRVYDMLGRRVRTLIDGPNEAGGHRHTWDGTTQSGTRVGSGVYVLRFQAGGTTQTKKVVVVR